MKNNTLIVLLFSVLLLTGCATTRHSPVEIVAVVNTPDQEQKVLFQKTRQWFSQYFVSGESVIDYEDIESGTIIGNGVAKIGTGTFGLIDHKIKYSIRIDTKDNKFRASTKVTEHYNNDGQSIYTVSYVPQDRISRAATHVTGVVKNLESYLVSKKVDSVSNW